MKNNKFKTTNKIIFCLLFFIIGFFLLFFCLDWRLNTNPSIKVGIYQLKKEKPQKNDYVSFCPPKNPIFLMALNRGYLKHGYCSIQSLPMMKKIIAQEGDTISIEKNGIYVNQVLIKNSQQQLKDGNNEKLPQPKIKNQILKKGELLLFGDNTPRSFDCRYFGILNENQIQIHGVLKPILIF